MYADNALTSRVNLLREICTTKYEDCNCAQEYISKIINGQKRLRNTGLVLPDELVASLLLAGFPDFFKPMIMALSNSTAKITTENVKIKIIEEATVAQSFESSQAHGLYSRSSFQKFSQRRQTSNTRSKNQLKKVRCRLCGRHGLYQNDCPDNKNTKTAYTAEDNFTEFFDESDDDDEDDDDIPVNVCVFLALLASQQNKQIEKKYWIIDSGASRHMCANEESFSHISETKVKHITLANNFKIKTAGKGDITLNCTNKNGLYQVKLKNVLYIPEITSNLLPVSRFAKKGAKIEFSGNTCVIKNQFNNIITTASIQDKGIYKIHLNDFSSSKNIHLKQQPLACTSNFELISTSANTKSSTTNDMHIWHRRLGHLNYKYLNQLQNAAEGISFKNSTPPLCEPCIQGKFVKNPFKPTSSRAQHILDLIHTDLCEADRTSFDGYKYFLIFYDDHLRMKFVYLLKNKFQTPKIFQTFITFIQNQTNKKIKAFRSDNGTEFINTKISEILQ